MKELISRLSPLTFFFVVLVSLLAPQGAFCQSTRVFFSTSGDTVLLYYEYFNPDTQYWIARFNVYGGIGEASPVIEEDYSIRKSQPIIARLTALKAKYQLNHEGVVIDRNAIPNLSIELEAKKKQKIVLPEGMYTRRYQTSYIIKQGEQTILEGDADRFLIGKQNRAEEIVESDILTIACWKHPTSPRYFNTYTANHQKLIIPMYRYSYVEKHIKDFLVYTF
ncbi:MAG: hypothetical protein ACI865_003477 [Flavobacteriaceae bacterium]|jgi:hypothetical protein